MALRPVWKWIGAGVSITIGTAILVVFVDQAAIKVEVPKPRHWLGAPVRVDVCGSLNAAELEAVRLRYLPACNLRLVNVVECGSCPDENVVPSRQEMPSGYVEVQVGPAELFHWKALSDGSTLGGCAYLPLPSHVGEDWDWLAGHMLGHICGYEHAQSAQGHPVLGHLMSDRYNPRHVGYSVAGLDWTETDQPK